MESTYAFATEDAENYEIGQKLRNRATGRLTKMREIKATTAVARLVSIDSRAIRKTTWDSLGGFSGFER